jgi:hypothetical protein
MNEAGAPRKGKGRSRLWGSVEYAMSDVCVFFIHFIYVFITTTVHLFL